MKTKKWLLMGALCAMLPVVFSSCSDDDDPIFEIIEEPTTTGVYLLNAGKWQGNNSTLDYYDPETKSLSTKVFATQNGRGLGDTANDMIIYGSKMYVAVNVSATIEVMDLAGNSLKTISPKDESNAPQQPRMLAAANGNVYVTLYDGHLACIDTTSMEIVKKVKVGPNPEGVCELNGKLYVANSGGLSAVQDSTLSVVNASTFEVEKNIVVTINPKTVQKDESGNLFVLSLGNYGDIKNTLQRVNVSTGELEIVETNNQLCSSVSGNKIYLYSAKQENWVVTEYDFKVYDIEKKSMQSGFITDGTVVDNTYCLSVDPISGNLYIGTSDYVSTGDMYIFSPEGKLIDQLALSGLNPMGAYFLAGVKLYAVDKILDWFCTGFLGCQLFTAQKVYIRNRFGR